MVALINDAWWHLLQEFAYVLAGVLIALHFFITLCLVLFGGTRAERSHVWGTRGAFTQPRFQGLDDR